jgi:hypothetical protein
MTYREQSFLLLFFKKEDFFFEKKKQKTFVPLGVSITRRRMGANTDGTLTDTARR